MRLPALLALLLAAAPLAHAQLESIDAPVSFAAAPSLVVPGSAVVLSGSTPLVTGQSGAVTLTITPPAQDGGDGDGTPITQQAPIDQSGNYSLSFSQTEAMGEYRVSVTAPDGKGSTTGKFAVMLLTEEKIGEQLTGTIYKAQQPIYKGADAAITAVWEIVRELPPSPEKEKLVKNLKAAEDEVKTLKEAVATGSVATGEWARTLSGLGAGGVIKAKLPPVIDALNEQSVETQVQEGRIRQRINESRAATDHCVKLDTAIELLNLASMLINIHDKPLQIVINLLSDKGIPAAIDSAKAPAVQGQPDKFEELKKFGLTQGFKAAAAFGQKGKEVGSGFGASIKPGSVTFAVGLLGDAVNFGLKYHYQKQCSRFEGPFTGILTSTFRHNGVPYWKYKITMQGKLILSAPKGKTATAMKGRFEGIVTEYDVQQKAVDVFASALKPYLLHEFLITPPLVASVARPGGAQVDEFGSYFNQLIPQSFYVPVEAVRKEDKIVLNVKEGGQIGLTPVFNQAKLYVVFMSGLIPDIQQQNMPMEGAEFLLSRAMKKDATFEIKTGGGTETIDKFFEREVSPEGSDVTVRFEVKVKACNPKCSKGSIEKATETIKELFK